MLNVQIVGKTEVAREEDKLILKDILGYTYSTDIENLLFSRHCRRSFGHGPEQDRHSPLLLGYLC